MKRLSSIVAFFALVVFAGCAQENEIDIPDFTQWKCQEPAVNIGENFIGRLMCSQEDGKEATVFFEKRNGRGFCIGWQEDGNVRVALFKNDKWILGAPGQGLSIIDKPEGLLFHVFDDAGGVKGFLLLKFPGEDTFIEK